MRAVFDTCVLFDDLALVGPRSQAILDQCDQSAFAVSIPEIVVLELVKHARNRIAKDVSQVEKGAAAAARLGVTAPRPPLDPERLTDDFERALRDRLDTTAVDVPGLPDVEHAEVVARSLAASKPFRPSDKGYRDTLLWHNVLEAVLEGGDDVIALVTGNTDDFADASKAALHPDLLADLRRIGRPQAVELVTSLAAFMDRYVPTSEQVLQQARHLLSDDPAFVHEVERMAARAIEDIRGWPHHADVTIVRAQRGESMVNEESPDSTDVEVLALLGEPEVLRAVEVSSGDAYVLELQVRAEVQYNMVFQPTAGEWLGERGSNVDFYDQSESYWAGFADGYVLATISATFDPDDHGLDDAELTEMVDLPEDDPHHPDAARATPPAG